MKIAILGYGIEGESVYGYYTKRYPDAQITIYDQSDTPKRQLPDGVDFVGGVKDFKGIDADIAIKTPAVPPWKVDISGELTSVTREFLQNSPAKVIGVTGSKGKGTVSSLIDAILRANGAKTWLVGNIGRPALDVLDSVVASDTVVYEMSSFQLWDLDVSPDIAVVLGIEPEHLDVHKDMDDYVGAKANIAKYQGRDDLLVFNASNPYARDIANTSTAQTIGYQSKDAAHVRDGYFCYGEQKLCSVNVLRLPGRHNQDNACAAIDAVWEYVQGNVPAITAGLGGFDGLPHRLKLVRSVNGVEYYDDSIATTPGSAIAAIRAFGGPKVLILGGSYKGASYGELAGIIAQPSSAVKSVILIGSEANAIQSALDAAGYTNIYNLGLDTTMTAIVQKASSESSAGDTVILSPSCASFDMFKNYQDRGEQFIEAVQSLG